MLLVDDNPDVRAYVRSVLAPQFQVLDAGDGKAGLDLAREALPDLIVADVMMPQLDGNALIELHRQAQSITASASLLDYLQALLAASRRHADIRTGPVGDDVRRPIDRSNTEVGSKRRGVYR